MFVPAGMWVPEYIVKLGYVKLDANVEQAVAGSCMTC